MKYPDDPYANHAMTMDFWWWISRFGQAEIVLPCTAALAIWLAAVGDRRTVLVWLGCLLVALVATVATKVAFLGWGLGIASLDFTGISGHTLMATAIWPVLLSRVTPRGHPAWHSAMALMGFTLALLVAISRLKLAAHSVSEVVAGFMLGGIVSGAAMFGAADAPRLRQGIISIALTLWLAVAPVELPASQAHGLVVRLALRLSNHAQPYTRGRASGAQQLGRKEASKAFQRQQDAGEV